MASNDPYLNDGYVWTTNRDGQLVRATDSQCMCVLMCVFPINILTAIIIMMNKSYDDLSEAGPIFWSKLTLNITDIISLIRFTRGAFLVGKRLLLSRD